jgi:hypothetical protein
MHRIKAGDIVIVKKLNNLINPNVPTRIKLNRIYKIEEVCDCPSPKYKCEHDREVKILGGYFCKESGVTKITTKLSRLLFGDSS